MALKIVPKCPKEYIHYYSDIWVPYNSKNENIVSFTKKNGETYLDFTKVTLFKEPSFEDLSEDSQIQATLVRPDEMVLTVEKQEKEKLLDLPHPEYVKALQERVLLYLKDYDTNDVFGWATVPYIERFTYKTAEELLLPLTEEERTRVLATPTKRFCFDRRGVIKSISYKRFKDYENIRNMISLENRKKLNAILNGKEKNSFHKRKFSICEFLIEPLIYG